MMNTAKKPSYENNIENLRLSRNGDESATERLVEDNRALVAGLARRFCGRGTEYEDLVQIGMIGMLKAIRTYDEERGCAFSTYAVPLILGEIRRHLRDDGLIKVSRVQKRTGAILMHEREAFILRCGREPQLDELCELCNVTSEEATAALDAISPVHSLSERISADGELTLESTLCDNDCEIDRRIDAIALKEALGCLEPLQRSIIMFRYFQDMSQEATAEKLGLTQVKVSREEKKIFERLRRELQ